MTEEILHYDSSPLHYVIEGHGPEILFIFHGFGQDRQAFKSFSESLSATYTLYIFDLYFHGQSQWGHGEHPLEKELWRRTFSRVLELHQIDKFSLCGFSLGGKFVLATLESFPTRIKSVILIAPDGIKTSFWYSLATYPLILRRLFKSMILHQGRFAMLSQTLNNLGLMDKGLIKFAEYQMNTEEKRRRVYFSWVVFRRFTFSLKHLAHLLNEHGIELILVTGKFDKVIRSDNMKALLKHVKVYKHEILETGHNGLIHEAIQLLKRLKG